MDLAPLVDDLTASQRLLVLTGAGMGLASGIPTFRGNDPDAVWANDVMEKGTRRYFERDPVGSWRWYRSRFAKLAGSKPNAGHAALVALEQWQRSRGRDFLLVTQNIDTLHRQAGSSHLVEVHGRADRLRCPTRRCANAAPAGFLAAAEVSWAEFDAAPSFHTLPKCPLCAAPLRAHVLWFDEYYTEHVDYDFERVIRFLPRADLILCVGTSFSVGVTQATLESPAPKWLIDLSADEPPGGVRQLRLPQEEALPALVATVSA